MPTGVEDRAYWISILERLAKPVLSALAEHRLKASLPIYQHPKGKDRETVTHLEAVGRLLTGIAPWLGCTGLAGEEAKLQQTLLTQVRYGIASICDPTSPDFLNFTTNQQPLVDAAFLSHGLLRATDALFTPLKDDAKTNVIAALKSSRAILPGANNWLLFAAMIEAFLCKVDAGWDVMRVDYAVRQHMQWYKGDGTYGDGPNYHWDYYNGLVIQPMLVDVVETCGTKSKAWDTFREQINKSFIRYAAVQERLISPEGTFPVIGRSMAYRMGGLQALAQVALRKELSKEIAPSQVRAALTAVMKRLMEAAGTFDKDGWLQIGFCGKQPGLGEPYISTGSLYLCSAALLPLGLPPSDPFWADDAKPWTSQQAYAGTDLMADHAV